MLNKALHSELHLAKQVSSSDSAGHPFLGSTDRQSQPQLTKDLWGIVFQHLNSVRDEAKAAGTCKAASAAAMPTKVVIPKGLPEEGTPACSHIIQ